MKSFAILSLAILAAVALPQADCAPPPAQQTIVALPAGTIIDGVGTTDFTITTKSDKARQLTRQGFALIHCFWFNEAVRSFRDATKEDPSCSAAWLGLNAALTLPWHSPGNHRAEAEYAIKRAVETCGDASDIEQGVIAAYRLRSARVDDRESEFEKAMMRVIETHPEVAEPRLLLGVIRTQLCMNEDYDSNFDPQTEMPKVMALIEPILKKDPNNPGALHYHIHALEGNKPELAVQSADRLFKAAPASGHMVHMPGHIYNRVGDYKKARESFLESVRVHEEYAKMIPGATPNVDWNYSHNVDYLIFNLSEMGRVKEATEMLEKNSGSWQKLAWRTGQWIKIAERSRTPYNQGMAAVQKGDLTAASAEADKLEASLKESEGRSLNRSNVTRSRMERIYANELRGLILSKQGKHDEAIAKLAEAVKTYELLGYSEPPYFARPPYETQGEVYLAAKKPAEALKAYENGLRHRPHSGWMLFGIAQAHEMLGDSDAASKAYQRFLGAWDDADEDLPQVVTAKKFLASQR